MTNQHPDQHPPQQQQWDNPDGTRGPKRSLWQRFKSWPLIGKICAIFLALGLLGGLMQLVDPEGTERRAEQAEADRVEREEEAAERQAEEDAEAEAEREAEEEAQRQADEEAAAEEEAEAERQAEEEAAAEREAEEERQREGEAAAEEEERQAAEAEEEAARDEEPEGIDAQIAGLSDVRGFSDAEIFYATGDDSYPRTSVNTFVTVEPGWSESSMCRTARDQTLRGLQFLRDEVTEDYDEAVFSFVAEGEADATGESSILGMATLYYHQDTVQAIDDGAAGITNIWEVADEGGKGVVCQRAEG